MNGEARDLVKEGTVTAVYPERHTVRCEFADKDGLISAELPVLTSWAFDNKMYHMPDVGEMVVCLFASNADNTGTGWVIGSRFHDKLPPNANKQDVTRIDFKDGTFIQYDRDKNELYISCEGDIRIDTKKTLQINCEEDITISGDKNLQIDCAKNVQIEGKKIYLN